MDRLTCAEVFERLNDYLDRELSAEEMERVREHLDTCVVCASEYAFEARVLEHVKDKLRRIDLPPALIERIRATLSDPRSRRSD
jgi:anti-sigma factor (TIGR02949 family)